MYVVFLHVNSFESSCRHCCGLQIRPVEEQLKQRVIGERYCISRKRKSYKRRTSRSRLDVYLSNFFYFVMFTTKAQGLMVLGEGKGAVLL